MRPWLTRQYLAPPPPGCERVRRTYAFDPQYFAYVPAVSIMALRFSSRVSLPHWSPVEALEFGRITAAHRRAVVEV